MPRTTNLLFRKTTEAMSKIRDILQRFQYVYFDKTIGYRLRRYLNSIRQILDKTSIC